MYYSLRQAYNKLICNNYLLACDYKLAALHAAEMQTIF